jgi:hypothetical protein
LGAGSLFPVPEKLWLKTKFRSVSKILNTLREALSRRTGEVSKNLTEEDCDYLKDILELIRIVSVDEEVSNIPDIDNSDLKKDIITRFCQDIHKNLENKITTLVAQSESDYAQKPEKTGGSRLYYLPFEGITFRNLSYCDWYIYWRKTDKALFTGIEIKPNYGYKKPVNDIIKKIIKNTDVVCLQDNEYSLFLAQDFTKDKFTVPAPNVYVEKIAGFYNWIVEVSKKI